MKGRNRVKEPDFGLILTLLLNSFDKFTRVYFLKDKLIIKID
jgi:hypothetical protein